MHDDVDYIEIRSEIKMKNCSVEVILFDALLGHASMPPPLWHPRKAIVTNEVSKFERGVRGMLPLGGLPLRGREGVTITNLQKTP